LPIVRIHHHGFVSSFSRGAFGRFSAALAVEDFIGAGVYQPEKLRLKPHFKAAPEGSCRWFTSH
jgi:hypothetical protein